MKKMLNEWKTYVTSLKPLGEATPAPHTEPVLPQVERRLRDLGIDQISRARAAIYFEFGPDSIYGGGFHAENTSSGPIAFAEFYRFPEGEYGDEPDYEDRVETLFDETVELYGPEIQTLIDNFINVVSETLQNLKMQQVATEVIDEMLEAFGSRHKISKMEVTLLAQMAQEGDATNIGMFTSPSIRHALEQLAAKGLVDIEGNIGGTYGTAVTLNDKGMQMLKKFQPLKRGDI